MGADYGAGTQEELIRQELSEIEQNFPEMNGMSLEELRERGSFTPTRTYYRYKINGFNTPTGKFEFYSNEMAENNGIPIPYWEEPSINPITRKDMTDEYPLILITGGRVQQYFISNNRQIVSLRNKYPFPRVKMNPETARRFGLNDGDWAWIETTQGRITQKVKYVPELCGNLLECSGYRRNRY